ncbi:hypothetical protein B0T17DRAFT_263848 [Bombardia bombarda]|uniref:Uncharacterized protein n=1 Tax=Bombardia bombarda TaxID=252184 RepID=A0AA39X0S6_9PEZI|nr:hypothetical protein B0T17DRAFT_263848 [Bombardia bombarda]
MSVCYRKEQEMETEMILEKAIGILVNAGQASVRATMEHIYSGTDQGTADLQGMLGNGVFLNDPSGDFSSPQIGDLFADATLVQLILLAWSLGQGQTPIVLYDKAGVDHPLKELVPSVYDAYFKPSAAAKTRFPGDFKGSDGNLYSVWLVDFSNFYDDGSFDTKYLFKELKGQDKLVYDDPKIGNEWGVSWHEYLESSFEGYLRNKKTNPYPLVSSSKLEYGDKDSGNFFALQKGTSSPGLIKLPVCTAYLVYENIAHWDDVKNQHPCDVFPCCLIDWKLSGNSPCEGLGPRCEPNGL